MGMISFFKNPDDTVRVRVEFDKEIPAVKTLGNDDCNLSINAKNEPVFMYMEHAEKIGPEFHDLPQRVKKYEDPTILELTPWERNLLTGYCEEEARLMIADYLEGQQ